MLVLFLFIFIATLDILLYITFNSSPFFIGPIKKWIEINKIRKGYKIHSNKMIQDPNYKKELIELATPHFYSKQNLNDCHLLAKFFSINFYDKHLGQIKTEMKATKFRFYSSVETISFHVLNQKMVDMYKECSYE